MFMLIAIGICLMAICYMQILDVNKKDVKSVVVAIDAGHDACVDGTGEGEWS